jgi:hypothetical protein
MRKGLEPRNGIAVLVVDDDPFVRMDLAEILDKPVFLSRKPAIRTRRWRS